MAAKNGLCPWHEAKDFGVNVTSNVNNGQSNRNHPIPWKKKCSFSEILHSWISCCQHVWFRDVRDLAMFERKDVSPRLATLWLETTGISALLTAYLFQISWSCSQSEPPSSRSRRYLNKSPPLIHSHTNIYYVVISWIGSIALNCHVSLADTSIKSQQPVCAVCLFTV